MQKLLTVSVAAYNVEQFIDECLLSFVDVEILDKLEVLIVDDGATDSTFRHAMEYQKKYPDAFKTIHKENGGWGSTVNSGIKRATGKYFKQLDGDDYFRIDGLKSLLDCLENCQSDIVLTPQEVFVSDSKKIIKINDAAKLFGCNYSVEYNIEDLEIKSFSMHQICIKTDLLKANKIDLLEHAFYTDAELVVKVLCYSRSLTFLPTPVYCYRVMRDGQSMSPAGIRKHYKEHQRVIYRLIDYISNNNINNRILLEYHIVLMINTQKLFYYTLKPSREHYNELKMFYESISRLCSFYKCDNSIINLKNTSQWFFLFCVACIRQESSGKYKELRNKYSGRANHGKEN